MEQDKRQLSHLTVITHHMIYFSLSPPVISLCSWAQWVASMSSIGFWCKGSIITPCFGKTISTVYIHCGEVNPRIHNLALLISSDIWVFCIFPSEKICALKCIGYAMVLVIIKVYLKKNLYTDQGRNCIFAKGYARSVWDNLPFYVKDFCQDIIW